MNNNINVKLNPPQGIRVDLDTVYVYDDTSIGDGVLTLQKNGETLDTFTANSKVDKTVNITVPTKTSDLTNDDGFITGITSSDITTALGYTPYDNTNPSGFITGITSSDVVTALGYTPYDSSNPSGYTTNVGTVTSVNNVSPVNGNVTISIPSEVTESTVSSWGFTKNTGTVTSVNNISPVNGNVSLTIPTVNNPTITFTQGGVEKGSITLNQSSNETIALDAGGGGSLPSQTGNTGKFLTTDGTNPSWASITIPTVNNATLTIQKNGTTVQTFTANASTNATANITVPTDTGDLTNGAGFITGIDSSDVTTALGYTPVNPTSLSTVATTGAYSDLTGKPTIPTVNDATLTIQKNGTSVGTFTSNQSTDETINITAMETDVSNITSTGKTACSGFALPSSTYENLTFGASGDTYTAPANGWFLAERITTSSSSNYLNITNTTSGLGLQFPSISISNAGVIVYVPACKNDVIQIKYGSNTKASYLKFIYSEGEV